MHHLTLDDNQLAIVRGALEYACSDDLHATTSPNYAANRAAWLDPQYLDNLRTLFRMTAAAKQLDGRPFDERLNTL